MGSPAIVLPGGIPILRPHDATGFRELGIQAQISTPLQIAIGRLILLLQGGEVLAPPPGVHVEAAS